jgi:hypothetical protein
MFNRTDPGQHSSFLKKKKQAAFKRKGKSW